MPLSLERTRRKRKSSSHSWQEKKKQRSKKQHPRGCNGVMSDEDGGWRLAAAANAMYFFI
jgi:hypothetical protein